MTENDIIIDQAACNANERSEYNHTKIVDDICNHFDEKGYYALTIKCIKHGYFATEAEVIKVMVECEKKHKANIHDFTIEQDSMGRNHIHAIMSARKGLRYNLYKKSFLTIDIRRLSSFVDLTAWAAYLHKEDIGSMRDYFTNGEYHFMD